VNASAIVVEFNDGSGWTTVTDAAIVTDSRTTYYAYDLTPGSYELRVTVVDEMGNEKPITKQVTIGTGTAPQIGDVSFSPELSDGAVSPNASQVTITVPFTDQQGDVTGTDATFDGQTVQVRLADGKVSYTVSGSKLSADTTHTFNVTLTDRGGHTVNKSVEFSVAAKSGNNSGGGGGGGGGGGAVTPPAVQTEIVSKSGDGFRAKITNARRGSAGVASPQGGVAVGDLMVEKLAVRPTSPTAEARFFVDASVSKSPAAGTNPLGVTQLGYLSLETTYIKAAKIDSVRVQFSVPTSVTAAPGTVSMYRWTGSRWTPVDTKVVRKGGNAHVLSAQASGTGPFAFGVPAAQVSVTDASVGSQSVTAGESVSVSASVENTGGATGTQMLTLTVDGETVKTKQVSVPGGKTKTVTFGVTLDEPGKHEIAVSGVSTGSVTVKSSDSAVGGTTQTGTKTGGTGGSGGGDDGDSSESIPGFGPAATLVALLAGLLVVRWRNR
jgi:PGF-CTERM protein